MAGAMRRMGVYLGLVEEDDYVDPEYDSPPEPEPAHRAEYREERAVPARLPAVPVTTYESSAANGYAEGSSNLQQITAVHPRTYNEARTIGEAFRKGTPVIMNLTDMDDSDAKRLVDFAAGLTFGLRGRIERVTAKVFLLSPHTVSVTAQDRAKMVESAFFNQS